MKFNSNETNIGSTARVAEIEFPPREDIVQAEIEFPPREDIEQAEKKFHMPRYLCSHSY
jgi:hypothetical protein